MPPKLSKHQKATLLMNTAFKRLQEIYQSGSAALENKILVPQFQSRVESLEIFYNDFKEHYLDLLDLISDSENEELSKRLEEADKVYFDSKALCIQLFPKVPETKNTFSEKVNVKLPKISLRMFEGDPKDFPSYFALFKSLIDSNKNLSSCEKMHYLVSTLGKEPLGVIKQLPIDENSYDIAISLLKTRYQNVRLLATNYLNEIMFSSKVNLESSADLRIILDTFAENLAGLKNLHFEIENWDFVLFNILLQKIDISTKTQFEKKFSDVEIPKYRDLVDFLNEHAKALDAVKSCTLDDKNKFKKTIKSPANHSSGSKSFLIKQEKFENCCICHSKHAITSCSKFLAKTPQQRYAVIKENRLCLNCLRSSHNVKQCSFHFRCKICKFPHNTLLHFGTENSENAAKFNAESSSNSNGSFNNSNNQGVSKQHPLVENTETSNTLTCQNVLTALSDSSSMFLLTTALVDILDGRGNLQRIKVIIDNGSQVSLLSDNLINRLGLQRSYHNTVVTGINSKAKITSKGITCCKISSVFDPKIHFSLEAVILPNIASHLPSTTFLTNKWSYLDNLQLADPGYNTKGPVDGLLGIEIFSQILRPGIIKGVNGGPTAINSSLGWLLTGKLENVSSDVRSFFITTDDCLDSSVKRFWELEEVPSLEKASLEDTICESIYANTVFRDSSGRFTVALPFKQNVSLNFVNSRNLALNRLYKLESRLAKDRETQQAYSDFLQVFIDKGYMSEVKPTLESSSYYIPHTFVARPESVSTKLRVVMDSSAKDAAGQSLNDCLYIGPKLQQDIFSLLLTLRSYPIILLGDICKMYLQINILEEQRDFLRLVWRFDKNKEVKDYRLNVVTFGVNSSPWLALRTMKQLAREGKESHPLASNILEKHLYMDDICAGFSCISDAIKAQKEIVDLLGGAGFNLHKWGSNAREVLEAINDPVDLQSYCFDKESCVKILGMQLDTHLDIFFYKTSPMNEICTKRTILSDVAKLFDPLGLLSPVVFLAKHILQHLWTLGLGWDSEAPREIKEFWNKFKEDLPNISNLQIPRYLNINYLDKVEVHGFSDASLKGFAACIYFRKCSLDGHFKTMLICAKSKVAPLKTISIARLELCGALLLSKLMSFVINCFKDAYNFSSIFAWTDSAITLHWIKSSPHKYKTFVANRISLIQENVAPEHWHHLESQFNVADFATKGLFPSELLNCTQWWRGPDFLLLQSNLWPVSKINLDLVDKEQRNISLLVVHSSEHLIDDLLNSFSSLSKVVGIVFYMNRFLHNLRCKSARKHLPMSALDFFESLLILVKHVQGTMFEQEITKIKNKEVCSKSFRKLNPFLDGNDILRVGGRLLNSNLSYEAKHPALLPKKHRLTTLLIEYYHKKFFHPGAQALHCFILQNFWIFSAKKVIISVISKCVRCFRVKPKFSEPLMGNLPKFRISQSKPFSVVGIDFAGPYNLTLGKSRGCHSQKGYICVFVCAATKCIHLECVGSLDSNAFLAALRRFVARRGRCTHIFSDCGTNFVGASRELIRLMKTSVEVEKIKWTFNVPGSPHVGGLFEAGVKSVKSHLKKVIGLQVLSYEEFNTLLVQIEAILNSRPLCSISSDPNDLSVLTPGHFLTLEPLSVVPDEDLSILALNRLDRWQLIQRMQAHFWKRWHLDYLHTLQQRNKWNVQVESNLIIGSLVLIKEENLPPLKWRLGRVVELHPGQDKIVRFASIKTLQGVLKRPLVKLSKLPIN